jgi:hypothetical protein
MTELQLDAAAWFGATIIYMVATSFVLVLAAAVIEAYKGDVGGAIKRAARWVGRIRYALGQRRAR